MSFLFPHTITIERLSRPDGPGLLNYGALSNATKTLIASNLPCNIRIARTGVERSDLPSATAYTTFYYIVMEANEDLIQTGDYLTDHLGRHYSVTAPDWGSLGHQFLAELLEN